MAVVVGAGAAFALIPGLRAKFLQDAPAQVATPNLATASAPAAAATLAVATPGQVPAPSVTKPEPQAALPVLGQVLKSFAIDFGQGHSDNDWTPVEEINGIRWKWPLSENDQHDYSMQGDIPKAAHKLPNVGSISVQLAGARTMMFSLGIEHMSEGSIPMSAFGASTIQEIRSSCTEDALTFIQKTYRVTLSGKRPLYLNHMYSAGASGSIEQFTAFQSQQGAMAAMGDGCVAQ